MPGRSGFVVYPDSMSSSIDPILPKAIVPPIAMGCLTALFQLPFAIMFFSAVLICRLAGAFANRV
jgi:hypothetical protein